MIHNVIVLFSKIVVAYDFKWMEASTVEKHNQFMEYGVLQ